MAGGKAEAARDSAARGAASGETIPVVGAALFRRGRVLAARRGPGMPLAGRWELPGGKVEARERPEEALRREIREELGVAVDVGEWLGRGESVARGRRIVLDVFEARLALGDDGRPAGELRPAEHDDTRWLGADELYALDWVDADVPLLPSLAARLQPPDAHRLPRDTPVVSADWGKRPGKGAVYVGEPGDPRTLVRREAPAGGWTLRALLDLAHGLQRTHGAPALVGIDAALGVPAAFAWKLRCESFLEILRTLERGGGLRAEARSAAAWSPHAPFFRVPAGAGGLQRFLEAAGGRSTMLRQIELRTRAKPVFATSGIPGTGGRRPGSPPGAPRRARAARPGGRGPRRARRSAHYLDVGWGEGGASSRLFIPCTASSRRSLTWTRRPFTVSRPAS